MIKPAICYKAEIENAMKEYFYSEDMMFYQGGIDSYPIEISDNSRNGQYEYAVVGRDDELIGYIAYQVDYYSSCAYAFGAFSFDRGNPIMGRELFELMEKLINTMHRVEFRAVSGNPAVRGYDKFLERHADVGNKHVLRDVFRDVEGNYRDVYVYEFVNAYT